MKPLSEEHLNSVRENFEFADLDGNGLIDFDEFRGLLRILSPESKLSQAAEGFSMIDTNSDGQIDYQEFLDWWEKVWWEF